MARLIVLLLCLTASYAAQPPACEAQVDSLGAKVDALMRQLQLQQLFVEEKVRSDADSGIKQVPTTSTGTRPYFSQTHVGDTVGNIRPVPSKKNMFDIGSLIAVLNGVEFRAKRHTIELRTPHKTSKTFHATEPITLPTVPPQVKSKGDVTKQIAEMREWFRNFQDVSTRSGRNFYPYFKSVFCYLEGTWLEADKKDPLSADFLNTQYNVKFQGYTGAYDDEKYDYLPTTMIDLINDTIPVFGKWNYRIMCHTPKTVIKRDRFRVIDNIALRMAKNLTFEEYKDSDYARFQLNPRNSKYDTSKSEYFAGRGLLDIIMEEIPGLDNYPGKNVDDGLFEAVYPLSSKIATQPKLNSAYYNRWFRVMRKGAMGLTVRHRGYSDESIFTAQTTQQKVAGMHLDACNGRGKSRVCVNYYQKWSYAVPLFVTYLTPLGQWNPYNLKKQTNDATVTSGGRTGGLSSTKAYNGYSDQHLYLTPAEFFSAPSTPEDPIKGVLDAKGTVRSVRASGQRFVFPEIPGVRGRVRQTYPIFPVHTDGSVVSKELAALVDMVTKSNTFANLFK